MKCSECGGELDMKVERTGKRNYDGGGGLRCQDGLGKIGLGWMWTRGLY